VKWAANAHTGDLYPFASIPIADDGLRFKRKAGGVISRKVPGGEVFARGGSKADDAIKGEDALRLLVAIKDLQRSGKKINRMVLNEAGHVLYREAGHLFFICALNAGLEFPLIQQEFGAFV
jgi:hypothetical protein